MVTIVKTFIIEKTPPPFTMFATVAPGARRPKSKMIGRSSRGTRWTVTQRTHASTRLDAIVTMTSTFRIENTITRSAGVSEIKESLKERLKRPVISGIVPVFAIKKSQVT